MGRGEGKATPMEPHQEPTEDPAAERAEDLMTLFQRLAAQQAAVAELLSSEAERLQRIQEEIDSWQPAAGWLQPGKEGGDPDERSQSRALPPPAPRAPWAAAALRCPAPQASRTGCYIRC